MPKSGFRSNQRSVSRRPVTAPTTMTAGLSIPASLTRRGELVEAGRDDALVGPRAPLDRRRRRRGIAAPRPHQARDHRVEGLHAHQDADGPADRGELAPVEGSASPGDAADDHHAGGDVPVRQRDAGVGRRAERRADARHHLERHPGPRERPPLPPNHARRGTDRRPSSERRCGPRGRARRALRRSPPVSRPSPPDRRRACRPSARRRPPARSSSAGWTSSSCSTTSAAARSSAPRSVEEPRIPGPAPTRYTTPGPGRARRSVVHCPHSRRAGALLGRIVTPPAHVKLPSFSRSCMADVDCHSDSADDVDPVRYAIRIAPGRFSVRRFLGVHSMRSVKLVEELLELPSAAFRTDGTSPAGSARSGPVKLTSSRAASRRSGPPR